MAARFEFVSFETEANGGEARARGHVVMSRVTSHASHNSKCPSGASDYLHHILALEPKPARGRSKAKIQMQKQKAKGRRSEKQEAIIQYCE
jgi:hypothetical protein